jgi:hypothetical protein
MGAGIVTTAAEGSKVTFFQPLRGVRGLGICIQLVNLHLLILFYHFLLHLLA